MRLSALPVHHTLVSVSKRTLPRYRSILWSNRFPEVPVVYSCHYEKNQCVGHNSGNAGRCCCAYGNADDKPVDDAFMKTCFLCHQIIKFETMTTEMTRMLIRRQRHCIHSLRTEVSVEMHLSRVRQLGIDWLFGRRPAGRTHRRAGTPSHSVRGRWLVPGIGPGAVNDSST